MKASDRKLHLTEVQLQEMIIARAKALGWHVHHTRPARRIDGSWSTPIQGDAGFVDLVLARNGRVLLVEVKAEKGRLSKVQAKWLTELGIGTSLQFDHFHEVYVWRPSDMAAIEETLA